MKCIELMCGASVILLLGHGAQADFIGVTVDEFDAGLPDGTTYRIYANFNNPLDVLLAIGGIPGLQPVSFNSPSPLLNDPWAGGSIKEDFPGKGEPWDSWVTIDFHPTTHTMCETPEDCPAIAGTHFEADDGGWFNADPGSPAQGTSLVIAQFSFSDDGPAGTASLEGLVNWVPAGGGPGFESTPFLVEWQLIPAPGALALLMLPQCLTPRRRRAS